MLLHAKRVFIPQKDPKFSTSCAYLYSVSESMYCKIHASVETVLTFGFVHKYARQAND